MHLPLPEAIAPEGEGVCTVVVNVIVLAADLADEPLEQHGAPSKQGRHAAIDPAAFVPATTRTRPDRRLVDLVAVPDEGVDGGLSWA